MSSSVLEHSEEYKVGDGRVTVQASLVQPAMLDPHMWSSFHYTKEDIRATVNRIDQASVWQLALISNWKGFAHEWTVTGIKTTFLGQQTQQFLHRKQIVDQYLSAVKLTSSGAPDRSSALCREKPDHKPLLPRWVVTSGEYDFWLRHVPDNLPSFCRIIEYGFVYRHPVNGWLYVPIQVDMDKRLIWMNRIVRETDYGSWPVHPRSTYLHIPPQVVFDGEEYRIMMDGFFMCRTGEMAH